MNTLLRNFSHTFRRFFTASVLNLLGLSIAFAACFVILTQVDYDYNYNKAYPAHDRIYRVEMNAGGDYGWQIWLARPFCELVGASSPHIQAISVTSLSNSLNDFEVDEHIGLRDLVITWRYFSLLWSVERPLRLMNPIMP